MKIWDWWKKRRIRVLERRLARWRDKDMQGLKAYAVRKSKEYQQHVDELRGRIDTLEHENERLSRELALARMEIEALTGIITRDRQRVEAETAIAAQRIEAAAIGLSRGGDD